MPSPEPSPWKHASVSLATEGQTKEKLTELLYTVLGQYGCHGCGRLIKVDMTFAADPGPELSKQGATSISHG